MSTTPGIRLPLPAATLCAGLLVAGCGAGYGPPHAPDNDQVRAAVTLLDLSARIALAMQGDADAPRLLAVPALVAGLSETAIVRGRVALGLEAPLPSAPGCVRGDARTGYALDGCEVAGGALAGRVAISPREVHYDLQVPRASAERRGYDLAGGLEKDQGWLRGELALATRDEEVTQPDGTKTSAGAGPAAKTRIVWSVMVDARTETRVMDGTIEVKVEAGGGEQDARFTFVDGMARTVEDNQE